MTKRVGAWLEKEGWAYVSTFGGAEIGCRVAQRVLEVTARPESMETGRRAAKRLGAGLARLREQHPFLRGVRQRGLVMGLQLDGSLGAVQLSRALYRRGVWAMFAGFDLSVLQWKPGLLVDDAYCDDLLERLDAALGDVEGASA